MAAGYANERPEHLVPIASFVVRCYLERKGDIWQAFSLEFGLAAQGESEADVRRKLDSMIRTYVHDALTIDGAHFEELFHRRATWQVYAKYYFVRASSFFSRLGNQETYTEALPVIPAAC